MVSGTPQLRQPEVKTQANHAIPGCTTLSRQGQVSSVVKAAEIKKVPELQAAVTQMGTRDTVVAEQGQRGVGTSNSNAKLEWISEQTRKWLKDQLKSLPEDRGQCGACDWKGTRKRPLIHIKQRCVQMF